MAHKATVDISSGTLEGVYINAFQGSIPDHLTKYGVSEETAASFTGENFAEVEMYLGIPFAEPPVGERALEKPVLFEGQFSDPLDCTKNPSACIQNKMLIELDGQGPDGKSWKSEYFDEELVKQPVNCSSDCLYLNVFRPVGENAPTEQLPVSVWIHGGGFQMGSAREYPADVLVAMTKRVVVVIQYRCGILGFFDGNYGLWDQRVALEWVQKEIHNFGGDPDNVHIFGESAGGAAVVYQLNYDAVMSNGPEKKKKLFKKATVMSGAADSEWAKTTKQWQRDLQAKTAHDYCSLWEDYTNTDSSIAGMKAYFKTVSDEKWMEMMSAESMMTFPMTEMITAQILSMANGNFAGPIEDDEFVFAETKEIDYTGYDVTFGTINGDGVMVSAFSSMTTVDIAISYELLGGVLRKYIDAQKDPSAAAIELYETKMDHESTEKWIKTNIGKHAVDEMALCKQLISSLYEPKNDSEIYNIPAEMQKMMHYASDRFFTLPMLRALCKVRENGGRVNCYHLCHGWDAGLKSNPFYSSPELEFLDELYKNGVNMHGDDIFFTFGQLLQPDHKELVEGTNSSDYEASISLMGFVMGDDFESGCPEDKLSVNAQRMGLDGKLEKISHFRRRQLEMYEKILPNLREMLAKKKVMKVKI